MPPPRRMRRWSSHVSGRRVRMRGRARCRRRSALRRRSRRAMPQVRSPSPNRRSSAHCWPAPVGATPRRSHSTTLTSPGEGDDPVADAVSFFQRIGPSAPAFRGIVGPELRSGRGAPRPSRWRHVARAIASRCRPLSGSGAPGRERRRGPARGDDRPLHARDRRARPRLSRGAARAAAARGRAGL